MTLNPLSLSKLKECLELAGEFVKDENSYYDGGAYASSYAGWNEIKLGQPAKKKSNDIRAKAELEASKLEKQEKCANLIKECLNFLKTVDEFENSVTKCGCQNK